MSESILPGMSNTYSIGTADPTCKQKISHKKLLDLTIWQKAWTMSGRYQDKSNIGIILNINEFIAINVYPPGYCLYWSLETRHTLEKPLFAAGFKETWIPLKSHADTAHLSTEHLAHLTATTPFFQFDSCHHPTRKVLMIICQPSFSWQIFIFSVASSIDPRIVPTKTELKKLLLH